MKSKFRFLIPIIVLAALGISAVGVAFGREMIDSDFFEVQDDEIEIIGVLEAMDADTWTVDGRSINVPPAAEVKGILMIGQVVKVHATMSADGTLTAREVELAQEDGNTNDNFDNDAWEDDNANDNSDDDVWDDDNDNDNSDDDVWDDDNANDNSDDDVWGDDNANDNSDDHEWDNDNANNNSDDHERDDDNSNNNDDDTNDNSDDDHGNDHHDDDHSKDNRGDFGDN